MDGGMNISLSLLCFHTIVFAFDGDVDVDDDGGGK
jgi:hypothetical protein